MVIGSVTPVMSVSWKASDPMSELDTWPVMQTIGEESIMAVAMPVTMLVAPGPEVAIATPTPPLARAKPSAMCAAPCSCRARTWWIGIVRHRVVDRQDRAARVAEDVGHALPREAFPDDLGAA